MNTISSVWKSSTNRQWHGTSNHTQERCAIERVHTEEAEKKHHSREKEINFFWWRCKPSQAITESIVIVCGGPYYMKMGAESEFFVRGWAFTLDILESWKSLLCARSTMDMSVLVVGICEIIFSCAFFTPPTPHPHHMSIILSTCLLSSPHTHSCVCSHSCSCEINSHSSRLLYRKCPDCPLNVFFILHWSCFPLFSSRRVFSISFLHWPTPAAFASWDFIFLCCVSHRRFWLLLFSFLEIVVV